MHISRNVYCRFLHWIVYGRTLLLSVPIQSLHSADPCSILSCPQSKPPPSADVTDTGHVAQTGTETGIELSSILTEWGAAVLVLVYRVE